MSTVSRRLSAFAAATVGAALCGALATGSVGFVSTTGVSMNPTFRSGDLVVVARADSYRVGQIVAYENPVDGGQILHRIVGGTAAAWDIRGDHNESIDVAHPTSDQLIGRAILHVTALGGFMTSPFLLPAAALAAALLLIGVNTMLSARSADYKTPRHQPRSRHTKGRRRLMGLLVLDALLISGAAIAFTLPHKESPPVPAAKQIGTFRYLGTAARTDTYPTGLIPTGTPVFTQLATTVDVTFDYVTDLPPSQVTANAQLDARISNDAGWNTVIPLAASTQMNDGTIALEGTLDLDQISDLAGRVADETGVNAAGAISLMIIATGKASVDRDAAVPFAFEMPMRLTPLTLTLAVETTDTPEGPVVSSQEPLTEDVGALTSSGVPTNVRRALLVALLLSLAATVAMWPPARAGDDSPTDEELHEELVSAGAGR